MENQPNQESSQTLRDRGISGAEQSGVAERAERAAMHMKSAAMEKVGAARQDAVSELGRGRGAVAARVRGVSTALKSVGEKIRDEDEVIAQYAERAGERIEGIARYIDSAEPREIVRDAEEVARTHPAWFFGGAFLLGLAAGRFLKASAEPAYAPGLQGGRRPSPRPYTGGISSRQGGLQPPPPPPLRHPSASSGPPRATTSASVGVAPTIDVPGSGTGIQANPQPGSSPSSRDVNQSRDINVSRDINPNPLGRS